MDQVRIGIIGIGNMGSGHCRNILEGKCPDIKLAAVADISPERRAFAKENYPESCLLYTSIGRVSTMPTTTETIMPMTNGCISVAVLTKLPNMYIK